MQFAAEPSTSPEEAVDSEPSVDCPQHHQDGDRHLQTKQPVKKMV